MVVTEEKEQFRNINAGPKGLGDPDDKSLRKVEKEVMIPKIMRDRAKAEKCVDEVKEFEMCCKSSKLAMVYKCREQNNLLKTCISSWYKNEQFINECTEIYLKERSEYRQTGLQKKHRDYLKERLIKHQDEEATNL